jgi:glycosyltransferase involved in cell wall biosynthesis
MSKPAQQSQDQLQQSAADISVAILYPGDRVGKMATPLEKSVMDVEIEPNDAYERDIVIADNADRDLGKEVLKKPFTDSQLVYRMRGDVFHELDLWDMHPAKDWIARNIVLQNVDATIAVTDRLAEKFIRHTGIQAGSAGLSKEVTDWPNVSHTESYLKALTLTNANYWQKVKPIVEYAPVVDRVLEEIEGFWHVCGDGDHTDRLASELEQYDNVHWMGYVGAQNYIKDCNLLIHVSNLDGQPNSVLEGMASNLPVITNDFVEFRRYDGPIDVFATEVELRKLLRSYTDPGKRQTAGRANREYIKANHSPEAIAHDYERLCAALL